MLKVINLWAEPGAGKSTTAAGLFNLLKLHGVNVELVTEYAKELVYEGDFIGLGDQLYVTAVQNHKLYRLRGHVEWAITDSPLPLSLVYATGAYFPWLEGTIQGAWSHYNNFNFLLTRVKPYQKIGRLQTEEEAANLRGHIRRLAYKFDYSGTLVELPADHRAPHEIAAKLGFWDGGEL